MRRLALLFAILSLIAAACGGGETAADSTTTTTSGTSTTSTAPTTTTTDPGFVVLSDDGRVAVEVPPGALAENPGITITRVAPENHPVELAEVDVPPIVYDLEPDGLQFDAPIRVSVTTQIADRGAEGFEDTLPVGTLITTEGDGWAFLDDIRITRDAASVTVSGSTDHFSALGLVWEQIFIRAHLLEITQDRTQRLGIEFVWSNGVSLTSPELTSSAFTPFDGQAGAAATGVEFTEGVLTLTCPPDITTAMGDLELEFLLRTVADTSGETGIVSAPKVTTLQDDQASVTVSSGLQLLCRPVITDDGSITIDLQVDHPGGAEIIPGEDFKGGLSAVYMDLGLGLPPLFVGLIRDVDSDGQIGPNDIMYPPEATEITEGVSTVVLPLFGFGDYFPYFLSSRPSGLETEVLVKNGSTILLGGLMPEETAVPYLSGIPFLARVFGDESRQTEDTKLVIFITPTLVQNEE